MQLIDLGHVSSSGRVTFVEQGFRVKQKLGDARDITQSESPMQETNQGKWYARRHSSPSSVSHYSSLLVAIRPRRSLYL